MHLVSISEAADMLGIHVDTLRQWDRAGKLIPNKTLGNHRRYDLDQIKQLIHGDRAMNRLYTIKNQKKDKLPIQLSILLGDKGYKYNIEHFELLIVSKNELIQELECNIILPDNFFVDVSFTISHCEFLRLILPSDVLEPNECYDFHMALTSANKIGQAKKTNDLVSIGNVYETTKFNSDIVLRCSEIKRRYNIFDPIYGLSFHKVMGTNR